MIQHVDDRAAPHPRATASSPRRCRLAAGEAGRDRSGQDVGHANVVVAQLLHQRFAERVERGLRRAVGGAAGKRILRREAADVDDPPAAPVAQVWNRRLAAVEHAGEVGADDAVPLVVRHIGDRHADADAGVVDEHVEAAELRDGRAHRQLRRAPHRARRRQSPCTGRRARRAARSACTTPSSVVPVIATVSPRAQQRLGHREANAPGAASNQNRSGHVTPVELAPAPGTRHDARGPSL